MNLNTRQTLSFACCAAAAFRDELIQQQQVMKKMELLKQECERKRSRAKSKHTEIQVIFSSLCKKFCMRLFGYPET
jgi:hypothetical protein